MPPLPKLPPEVKVLLASEGAHEEAIAEALHAIENDLRQQGLQHEAEAVGEIIHELPFFGRMGRRLGTWMRPLRRLAARQWLLFQTELAESRDLFLLLQRRLSGDIVTFSPEEEKAIRAQLLDIFRVVPATVLALAPVPGVVFVTPLLLKKLNLLPSAWREAYVADRMARAITQLRRKGREEAARSLEQALQRMHDIQHDRSDRIRTLYRYPRLREVYDTDGDGVLAPEEWETLKAERRTLQEMLQRGDDVRCYYSVDGRVEGPLTLQGALETPLPDYAVLYVDALGRWLPQDYFAEAISGAALNTDNDLA